MREFRSVQAWRSSRKLINARVRGAVRALGWRFKRKRTWCSWHHDLESIRHDLESLCSDNDPRCHMRKIKIISSDWIALLHRLLMRDKITFLPLPEKIISCSSLNSSIPHCKCWFALSCNILHTFCSNFIYILGDHPTSAITWFS